jgi:GT2 family glycosyltransferase
VTIIDGDKNLGFVENINRGIKSAKGEYIYLLNSNVEVQENYLSYLLDVLKQKKMQEL